ncbi:MAG: N-acetylmuramic acid 6-phosphate etherase, partial [Candidatus Hydrothermota bacterium]
RLGVLDAAELPPTYGTPFWLVQGLIAGGYGALIRAQEGAEDHPENAVNDLKERGVVAGDFVIGLAASKRTPYVVGGLKYAREIGAKTALITAIPREKVDIDVDVLICPVVGPEVIMGSTRMKAGTAQKLVLNMISTTAMIRLGKVYENMMVDLWATSKKLVERSKRVIMIATGVDYETAAKYLELAKGSVKIAIVMILSGADYDEAKRQLDEADGFVRFAIEKIRRDGKKP